MSDRELVSRLQRFVPTIKRRQDEAIERLRSLFKEYMKKPLDEQLKMAREALDYGSS